MTWVKKISPDWHPEEWRNINIGEIMDFPAPVDQLLQEGKVVLCDDRGNEIPTEKTQQEQEELKQQLKEEQQELLVEVEKLKQKTVDPEIEKKKAWAAKMAAARAAKKAAKK